MYVYGLIWYCSLAQVIAVDNADPARTGTATIAVTVTGVNDNTPVITNPPGK